MKNVTIPSQFLQELLALCGPEDHELRERVLLAAAPVHPAEGVPAQPLQMFESPRAKILMQAWQEGFAACRDAEYVGEEAENDAFNQSMTLNHCIAEDELHATHPTQQGLDWLRWQIVHDHISGEYIAGRACFVVQIPALAGANIMRGSVAEHFTKAVDAIAAQAKQTEALQTARNGGCGCCSNACADRADGCRFVHESPSAADVAAAQAKQGEQ